MKFGVVAIVATLAVAAATPAARPAARAPAAAEDADAALTAAYNLDYVEALSIARRAVTRDPASSRAHRALASILWMRLQFERGTITVDHYLGGISPRSAAINLDRDSAEEFRGALAEAIRLAEKRLRQKPGDVDAMFDAGAAYGVQALYMTSVEGGFAGAFRYARRAFETQSAVLDRDPSRAAAGLIVGNYRYLIASQMVLVRFFAFLAGFGGGRDRAIGLLEAASHDPISRVEAKTALMLIYSREGRHNEALRLTRELAIELPGNRLFQLEEGAAAIRAGRYDEADAALTRGLAAFEHDTRQKLPGEHALWLYKRGLARLNLNRPEDAATDLRRALASNPVGWVEGRVHVALGKLADLAGRRAEATAEYNRARTACQAYPDATCRAEARQFLRQPYAHGG